MSPNTTPMHARVAGAHACVGNMRTAVPAFAAMPCAMARSSPLVASSHCLPQGSRLRRLSLRRVQLQQGFVTDGMGFRVKLHSGNFEPLMSALGQKQTSEHVRFDVCFTPKSGHSRRRSGISLAIKFRVADMRGLHAGTRQPLAELIRKLIGTEIGEPVRSGGNIMVLKIGASAMALLLMSSIAIAQQQSNAVRVRGTIESKDHQTLNVKAR